MRDERRENLKGEARAVARIERDILLVLEDSKRWADHATVKWIKETYFGAKEATDEELASFIRSGKKEEKPNLEALEFTIEQAIGLPYRLLTIKHRMISGEYDCEVERRGGREEDVFGFATKARPKA